jgi:ketosteroid isomerase-like protein
VLTIEQRLQHLEDEAAIRDLAARFADAATRADYETIGSLFTPDAVFAIGEPFAVTCKGPNEIVALIHRLRDGKDFFVEFVHSGLIQLDGNTASARWLLREVGLGPAKSVRERATTTISGSSSMNSRKSMGNGSRSPFVVSTGTSTSCA